MLSGVELRAEIMNALEAKKFIRRVMGPPRRTLEGNEREHMLTVFALLGPISSTNNQHTWTDVYEHAGKTYHHTIGASVDELEEILTDDFQ